MFGLLTRKKPVHPPRRRQARLQLEHLESRDVPSTLSVSVNWGIDRVYSLTGKLTDTATPGGQTVVFSGVVNGTTVTQSDGSFMFLPGNPTLGTVTASTAGASPVSINVADTPPVITALHAVQSSGNYWCFDGQVSYSGNPCDVTVKFGGAPVSLQNQSVTCDMTGHFDLWLMLNGTSTDNGTFTAQGVTSWGTLSDVASGNVYQMGT
jgi:hypothetical protein